jgi:hypothetical protein
LIHGNNGKINKTKYNLILINKISNMEDKDSPNKIKRVIQIYYNEKNSILTWKDIKHLELEDDDEIMIIW